MLVRETAARELEERRADWGYSKPVVALDMLWNTAFVVVSIVMLILTVNENPNTPVRLWICGYALQCLVHVVLVWLEYRRRNTRRARDEERQQETEGGNLDSEDEDGSDRGSLSSSRSSVAKRCESVNTLASFLWWIVGFYWVVSGGDVLLQRAPRQEGASEADLSMLPKYRFHVMDNEEKPIVGSGKMIPIESSSGYLANERILFLRMLNAVYVSAHMRMEQSSIHFLATIISIQHVL
ncbi:hypothetical protein GH714_006911 [Hevea brasiliensis]|uniref:RING-type E3 ubiquitin transferase n=1 Tax=Hevea brasiliensis TaxID=3981 RepID=A0A6A6M119_HEVBR|nr:hypothetical protein GH714_007078 [Hevea brasiliensis]KAF2308413.1 hypothetical protein GH714_006911 [Hevea brasiliensis]